MRLPIHHLFALPVALSLAAQLLLALGYASRRRRAARSGKMRRERIYRCASCRHVYSDRRDVPLAGCPRCGELNEAVRR